MQQHQQLSERDRSILRGVIEAYLLTGEPVSSRQLARSDRHGLSAASLRNIMADLDDMGLLKQPHTSAGRVPTAAGYHLFIDSLMEARRPSDEDLRAIEDQLGGTGGDGEQLTTAASQLLSRLSSQIGIVVTPDLGTSALRTVEFVPLSGNKVLCVTASSSGFIDNKVFELEQPLDREELIRVSNYLTESFQGLTLRQIRDRLLGLMADERAEVDELLGRAILLARQGLELSHGPRLVVEGTESLLGQPELSDLPRIRRLFETFTDKARVVALLNRSVEGQGVRVFIGEESDLTSELDFSLILRSYEVGGRSAGSLGLFGPSRMEYARLIPLVDYLGERLSAALSATM
jgi:heat-inducible transcriptional repressor